GDDQRQASRQPMGERLGEEAPFQRQRRKRQLLEATVLEFLLEQAVEGKEGSEERHGPEQARGDAGGQGRLRPDAEGKDHHREQIEGQSDERVAALAQDQLQVAPDQTDKSNAAHAAAIPSEVLPTVPRSSASAPGQGWEPWSAITASPPIAR